MVNFKDFVDYFEKLAEKHKEINHNVNGDKSFFNVDILEMMSGLKSKTSKDNFNMILINYNSTLNQSIASEKEIMLFFLKKQSKGNHQENVDIRSKAEIIAQEIVAKIQADCTKKPRDPKLNEMFRGSMDIIDNIEIGHVDIFASAEKLIGVQCTIPNKFNYCPTIREDIFRD